MSIYFILKVLGPFDDTPFRWKNGGLEHGFDQEECHYWKCPFCGHQPPTARWATAQQYAPALQSILDTLKPIPVPSSPISFDVHPGFFKPQPAQLALSEKTSRKRLLDRIA